MGRSKKTPDRSQIVRAKAPAFSRRQRGEKGDGDGDDKGETAPDDAPAEGASRAERQTQPVAVVTPPADTEAASPGASAPIDPPPPLTEPWPDATPTPMKPVEPGESVRIRMETVAGAPSAPFGGPPDMPRTSAPPPLMLGEVENPAHMPGPKDIPAGNPDDPAPAPGTVPRGDSRSLRRDSEFALVYRVGTCVITRFGTVGRRGQWRVVEYPTSTFASNSYAKECSRFVSEGFSDYRE